MTKPKGKGFFQKIQPELLLSPGGVLIIFLTILIEIIGIIIPIPIIGSLIQFPFQVLLIILLITVAKVSIKSMIIPYIVDFLFPAFPSWAVTLLIEVLMN